MSWFNKIGTALSQKFSIDFKEDTTEAELIDMVESLQGIEDLRNENTELTERIDVVDALNVELSQKIEALTERANNNATQLQAVEAQMNDMKVTVERLAGKPLQTGADNSQPHFTKSEEAAHEGFKRLQVTLNNK